MKKSERSNAEREIINATSMLISAAVNEAVDEVVDDLEVYIDIEDDALKISASAFHPNFPDNVVCKKFDFMSVVMGIFDEYTNIASSADELEMYAQKFDTIASAFREKAGLQPTNNSTPSASPSAPDAQTRQPTD